MTTFAVWLAVVVVVIVAAVMARRRLPWNLEAPDLGYVSQQWLAEYRASHPR